MLGLADVPRGPYEGIDRRRRSDGAADRCRRGGRCRPRLIGADAVADAGHDVLEASSADEALTILQGAEQVHILFSDIRMPGTMDGMQLARIVHDRWPAIRIVLTSGDTFLQDRDVPDHGRFLAKPYKVDALQRTIAELAS
jgi:two-component system, response regulator PdtaR